MSCELQGEEDLGGKEGAPAEDEQPCSCPGEDMPGTWVDMGDRGAPLQMGCFPEASAEDAVLGMDPGPGPSRDTEMDAAPPSSPYRQTAEVSCSWDCSVPDRRI